MWVSEWERLLIVGYWSMTSDQLAATLNDVLTRLKAAFEAERSFAANAAHELRTPLAGAIAQVATTARRDGRPFRRRPGCRNRDDFEAAHPTFGAPAAIGPRRGWPLGG